MLPASVNEAFEDVCPGLRTEAVHPGQGLPADIKVMIAGPGASMRAAECPAGWPFDLEWIHLISTGLDGYPDWLYQASIVTYSPGVSAVPLAEYCLAAILAAAKHLPELWIEGAERWVFSQIELVQGSTLGIIGFGSIGSALAERACALGMEVQVLRGSDTPLPAGIRRATDLAEILATSDHLVLAAPATSLTFRMIDATALRMAKPGLHLINVGRGTLIDQDALLDAIADGRVSRATLDVTDPEPLPAGHPFYAHPRIFLTPHTASSDTQVLRRLAAIFAANVSRFLAGQPLRYVVGKREFV